jgi:hypothetical protein
MAMPDIRVAGTQSGNSPETHQFPEAAVGATFEIGQFVVLNDAGKIEEAADNGIVVGVAAEDATGVEDTMTLVWPLNDDTVFVGSAETGASLAQTLVGAAVDLTVTAGVHLINESGTTDLLFKVVRVDEDNDLVYFTGNDGLPGGATGSQWLGNPSRPAAST